MVCRPTGVHNNTVRTLAAAARPYNGSKCRTRVSQSCGRAMLTGEAHLVYLLTDACCYAWCLQTVRLRSSRSSTSTVASHNQDISQQQSAFRRTTPTRSRTPTRTCPVHPGRAVTVPRSSQSVTLSDLDVMLAVTKSLWSSSGT